MKTMLSINVTGHVLIRDDLGNILVDRENEIHPQHMAVALARGLSNTANFQIYKLKLGNQGTYIDSTQQIVFRPANVTGDSADLYNPTYVEIVDESNVSVGSGNSVTFTNVPPPSTNTRVIITAVISANEAVNNTTDTGTPGQISSPGGGVGNAGGDLYFFDELGLFTKETSGTLLNGVGELLLSHLIFSPIEKTANREITVVYALTIACS